MQIKIQKDTLLPALTRAQSVADKKSTMPMLGNVLLTADRVLRVAATDLQQSVTDELAAEVESAGSVAVDARGLLDRVKNLGAEIAISAKGSAVTLKSGSRRFTMHGVPGEEFPKVPTTEAETTLVVPGDSLARLIGAAAYAISTDETRLHLNSAKLECSGSTLRMVATDGHRLSVAEVDLEGVSRSVDMLVPLSGVLELKRLCELGGELALTIDGPNLFVGAGSTRYSARLTDAQFPPWQQVIPESSARSAVVPVAALADALRAVRVSANARAGIVKLTFADGKLRVESESPEAGEGFDELPIDYNGGDLTIGVNAQYVLDALGPIAAADVKLEFSGELDPLVLRVDGGGNDVAVIMPARV